MSAPNPPREADLSVTLPDGRILAYSEFGSPEGNPIIFAHGMPGSRLEGQFFHHRAQAAGFRILAVDRPGIGQSSYQHGRVLLDYSDDIRSFADQLGLGQFIHMGWSSGGSRTLACARRLPERVSTAVILSGYTHFAECDDCRTLLLKTRWPGPMIAEFSPSLFRALVAMVVWVARRRPTLFLREARAMVSDQDRQVLGDPARRAMFRHDQVACLNSGGRAIATDLLTELTDWGFRLAEVEVPTLIYQGQQDPFVPVRFARHMAEHIADSSLTLLPEAGHLYPLDPDFQDQLFRILRQRLERPSKALA